jgi:anti-sigma B factor antagonist
MSAPHLDIQDVAAGRRHKLVLKGELDIASVREFHRQFVDACDEGAQEIAIDLSGLGFMDSSGLYALLTARRICQQQGVGFVLTPPQGMVRRLFEVTGMLDELPFAA